MKTKFTHNDLKIGDEIKVRTFPNYRTVLEIEDGYRGVKVTYPGGGTWIDVADVTAIRRRLA